MNWEEGEKRMEQIMRNGNDGEHYKLEGTVGVILGERRKRYGDFSGHARIAQAIKEEMRNTTGWARLDHHQAEALEMIAHKIARILNGDPNYQDSWLDIAGYAQLVADDLA